MGGNRFDSIKFSQSAQRRLSVDVVVVRSHPDIQVGVSVSPKIVSTS